MNGLLPATLRRSSFAAHALPLVVFLVFNLAPAWLRIENSELPWYRRAPEHWVYPLQTLVCGGLLIAFRQHYKLAPWRCFSLAVALAGIGIAFWIAPSWLYVWFGARGEAAPRLLQWLGVTARQGGFDPGVLAAWPAWETAAIGMRFVRLVLVVPFVEEIFWRGFLMRFLATDEGPWETAEFGTHRWKSYTVVTLFVMLAHAPRDYAAAWVFGSLMYFLAVRGRSLGACIFMHATANLLLGVYVMKAHAWGLW